MQHRWHGDTEKAYYLAFEEASEAGAILLLDEVDSILYSRTLTHTGWELSKINVLLKLLEEPAFPVILCTNLLPYLDAAIHRRLHYVLEFPAPSAEERKKLWTLELEARNLRPFPAVDLTALAAVPLTGGLIHNAVIQAARRKTVDPRTFRVNTSSLLTLARKELPKLQLERSERRIIGFATRSEVACQPLPSALAASVRR
jgi:SpoVK/Ycf46/Vps4 family AAA+-type ATPase